MIDKLIKITRRRCSGRRLKQKEMQSNARGPESRPYRPSYLDVSNNILRQATKDINGLSVNDVFLLQQIIGNRTVGQLSNNVLMRQRSDKSDSRRRNSAESKPKDAPRGTKPIDQTGLSHDQIHDIKRGVGARPQDWVGISPEGEVITSDEEGKAVNNGEWETYTLSKYEVPSWLWKALAGVTLAAGTLATIACYVSGPCTVATLISGLGYSAAMLIINLLGDSKKSRESAAALEMKPSSDSQTSLKSYA